MPAKYRYTFDGSTILINEPLNWDNLTVNFKRSAELGGITKSFTQDLEFWGDGNDYLRAEYLLNGILGSVDVLVEIYSFDNYAYEDFYIGKINFTNYSEVQNEEGLNFVITNIESTSFEQNFVNGVDVPINVYGLKTRTGATMQPFPNWEVVPADVSGQIINKVINTSLGDPTTAQDEDSIGKNSDENAPNWRIDINQLKDEDATIPFQPTDTEMSLYTIYSQLNAPILISPQYGGLMTISGEIDFDLNVACSTGTMTFLSVQVLYGIKGYIGTETDRFFYAYTQNLPVVGNSINANIQANFSGTLNVVSGNEQVVCEIVFSILKDGLVALTYSTLDMSVNTYDMDVVQNTESSPSVINGQFPFEAFTRMTNFLTEQADRVQGDAISRTNQHIFPAQSDGIASKMLSATGLSVRQYPLIEAPLAMTVRQLFRSLNYGFNLGIGVVTISGVEYVIVDDIEVFYDKNTTILTVEQSVRNIKRTVMTDEYFSSLIVGYDKYKIEDRNFQNTQEFNTQRSYVSGVDNVLNTKSILSPFIGAGLGLEYQRRNKYFTPANGNAPDGNRFDDDVFIIACHFENPNYRQENPKDFFGAQVIVNNLENSDSSFNMRISPRQAMERHKITNNAVDWRINKNVLAFSGEKVGNIEMSTTDPDFAENEDVSTTETSLFENETLEFEMDWGIQETQALDANRYGVIVLSTPEIEFTGFVQEVSHNVERGVASVTLRRVGEPT